MSYADPIDKYNGVINTLSWGDSDKNIAAGGENCLPFYIFEGEIPNRPVLALEVLDIKPSNWPQALIDVYGDVYDDPVKWAKKCAEEYKAPCIMLTLNGTDPNGLDKSPEEASRTVTEVLSAVDVPLIVYGTGSIGKDSEVLKKVAEDNAKYNFLLGFAQEDNYKTIAAAGMGFNKSIVGQTPLDINLAKQLNILITQLGLDPQRIAMDPTTGGLGYGIEYSYSVIERLKLAALKQGDKMTQMPMLNNVGQEVWKIKENKIRFEDDPSIGDPNERGIAWEVITAVTLLVAGSNIVVIRHPRSLQTVSSIVDDLF
jgi:acetyl-CoA decarbonylase/synthase complex subunit delta